MTINQVDLTESNKDYAVFLPSISGFYTKTLSKPDLRTPPGFENGMEGLNFLNEKEGYYKYKWGLYSAGHACLNLDECMAQEPMIQKREKDKTFILGDSGGFQIMTGVLKCDWATFKTDDTLRQKILNWLEHTADYSMVLDVPTLAITPGYTEKTGLTKFDDCLDYTKFNNDWMIANRTWNTKFLNSMQGRYLDEAIYWFDQTKHYAFEGFGFGGATTRNLHILLHLLIRMRDQKLLEKGERDHLHFLGMSKPEWAIYYTTIKRMLQQTVNSDMQVSYDAASAFITAVKGQMLTSSDVSSKRMNFTIDSAIDDRALAGSDLPLPWRSPIFDRLTVGDICRRGRGVPNTAALLEAGLTEEDLYTDAVHLNNDDLWDVMGDKNKQDKVTKTSWDIESYTLVMGHNVFDTIECLQKANQMADLASVMNTIDYNDYLAVANKKSNLNLNAQIPTNMLITNEIIKDVLTSETPFDVLAKAQDFLGRSTVMKSSNSPTTFDSLFS